MLPYSLEPPNFAKTDPEVLEAFENLLFQHRELNKAVESAFDSYNKAQTLDERAILYRAYRKVVEIRRKTLPKLRQHYYYTLRKAQKNQTIPKTGSFTLNPSEIKMYNRITYQQTAIPYTWTVTNPQTYSTTVLCPDPPVIIIKTHIKLPKNQPLLATFHLPEKKLILQHPAPSEINPSLTIKEWVSHSLKESEAHLDTILLLPQQDEH